MAMAMASLKSALFAVLVCCLLSSIVGQQEYHDLAIRLEAISGGGTTIDCWNSLIELKSCTGEVILFFLNGETYLGQSCCRAIRVIQEQCWPDMLTAIGFTPHEDDVLKGYCIAADDHRPNITSPTATKSTPPPCAV
ncbi:Egg cell-secreted protein 1.2 [Zostera marina]|uniref:Egg cell-secreted protein 1.2 n=1 Tax=Zostera marina TaxID=29655 RepID=A0A0K9NWC5_ZOSMR|nr:Egg cell-secreted protein 1.2 [Zostera marina]